MEMERYLFKNLPETSKILQRSWKIEYLAEVSKQIQKFGELCNQRIFILKIARNSWSI